MKNFKTILSLIFLILIASSAYSQQGYYVDKDARIKKYQSEMVDFLAENHQFGSTRTSESKENFMRMFVYKTLELFPLSDKPEMPSILLVKFGSLGDHATHYWGILETGSKLFFLNIDSPNKELLKYMDMRKYDRKIQDIILHTLGLYKPHEP